VYELPGVTVLAQLGMARAAGLALEPLCRGLSFSPHTLRRLQRVPWDEFCTLCERIEEAAGEPDGFAELCARNFQNGLAKDSRTVLAAFAEPKALFHFLFKVVYPFVWPPLAANCQVLAEDQIRIVLRTHPGARPCLAFFSGSVGAHRGITAQFGMPLAEAVVEELTARSLVATLHLPPSTTLQQGAAELAPGLAGGRLKKARVRGRGELIGRMWNVSAGP
jgi:hypothetical protein